MIEAGEKSQLINAKYKLTKSEINFITLVIYNIKNDDSEFTDYYVKIKDFDEELEFEKNIINLKQFVKKLMSKTLEVSTNDGFILFNWFSKIRYLENKAIFIVNIDRNLKIYLLELKEKYSNYNLKYILPLTSNYSITIYQLLKPFQNSTKKLIDVLDLMRLLDVPKSLQIYSDFKRKVLLVAQKELYEHTDIYFEIEEKKDGRKITQLLLHIYINSKNISKDEIKRTQVELKTPSIDIVEVKEKKELIKDVKENIDNYNAEIKRIVTIFDQERKKIQPNYVRKEYRNIDGAYLLKVHLKETKRTPKMFFDAIRWLFSNNPKATFHRSYIMNIAKLIEHFNTLEHQAMYSQEAVQFNDEAKAWYNVYKKQGKSDEEIMQILRDGGYIK